MLQPIIVALIAVKGPGSKPIHLASSAGGTIRVGIVGSPDAAAEFACPLLGDRYIPSGGMASRTSFRFSIRFRCPYMTASETECEIDIARIISLYVIGLIHYVPLCVNDLHLISFCLY